MTRLCITYAVTCAPDETIEVRARHLAIEQSAELAEPCLSAAVLDRIVGRVESITPLEESRWRVVITYDPVITGSDVPQILNVLFGNISMQRGIFVEEMTLPSHDLDVLPGPARGIDGLRALARVEGERPLCGTALKPLGESAKQLADRCYRFALGGLDFIKDDHGLSDQSPAPFADRVRWCQDAVRRANRESGYSTLYLPNLTGPVGDWQRRAELAEDAGCAGGMLAPLLVGPDTLRAVREARSLALLAHSAFTGAFFGSTHGIAPGVLLGTLFRALGADGVVFPAAGGRFAFTSDMCGDVVMRLTAPLGSMLSAAPIMGGGMTPERVSSLVRTYGSNIGVLAGSSLYLDNDLTGSAARLRGAVESATSTTS